jgi:hypothetical protein
MKAYLVLDLSVNDLGGFASLKFPYSSQNIQEYT